MLAGHDECSAEIHRELVGETIIQYPHRTETVPATAPVMEFRGMSSKAAQEDHNGGHPDYRAAEGIEMQVPYKGPVAATLQEILGGLRSTCTYTGSRKLKELPKRTTFGIIK
jgi:IMP dehydrogenase/GMP reductase